MHTSKATIEETVGRVIHIGERRRNFCHKFAMEDAQVRLGDITSADVKLWLTDPNDQKYQRNPLHLHSLILNKSEYFIAKMSEHWSTDKPKEIRLITSHNFDDYLKWIEFMYMENVYFSDVDECLAILSVASELLIDDLIEKCMQYLQAVRWSPQQETQIADILSSLSLKPIPDLAARFERNKEEYLIIVESIINEMVSIIKTPQCAANRDTAEKYIAGMLEGNESRENKELCERVLLQEFKSSITSRNFKTMRSLIEFFERCKGEMLKTAFNAFYGDLENKESIISTENCKRPDFSSNMLPTMICLMQAIGNGKIIVSRDNRVLFVRKCVSIMANAFSGTTNKLTELDKAVVKVVESLPVKDRKRICVEWMRLYRKCFLDLAKPFALLKDLHDANHKSTSTE